MEGYYNKGVDPMFLHIGGNIAILEKDIVAIIDKESINSSRVNKEFIDNMMKNGFLYGGDVNNIKTYIITCVRRIGAKNIKRYGLYTSSISSTTLSKRNKYIKKQIGG